MMYFIISEPPQWWDWAATNAGLLGGIASGLASGLVAYRVFRLGLKAERDKQKEQEEKHLSELAFQGLFKAQEWFNHGFQSYRTVRSMLDEREEEIAHGAPKSMVVMPIVESLPQPENIAIAEVSFLASRNNTELINKIYEIQRWGYHLSALTSEFTNQRLAWDEWSLANSQSEGMEDSPDGISSVFSDSLALQAQIRVRKMDKILEGILEGGDETISRHSETIKDYIKACRDKYPETFPKISFKVIERNEVGGEL
ncbi:MAG: hypothetical protein ABGX47_06265 [Martelella sp.]|uniref:hypothetical protein n=1 Tax=Martelella sp. TaxID=1969699 RepID=UPI003241E3DF